MLKTVIFDIDGTLWHTGASYVYAYHKLCDHYGVMERKSNDEIKACLGIKIDQVLRYLFPQVEDQGKLAFQAMNYSIEYLMAHAGECCFTGTNNRMSKRGSPYLRRALWQASTIAVRYDPALREYFQKKRTEGKPYMNAIGHVMRKLTNIIFAVLRDNKPYYIPLDK